MERYSGVPKYGSQTKSPAATSSQISTRIQSFLHFVQSCRASRAFNAMAAGLTSDSQSEQSVLLALFVGMGALSCIELIIIIPSYFKQWNGMYFWGVVFATAGATMMTIGNLLLFLFLTDRLHGLSITLIQLGYAIYCPADFVVIYSRLHLVGASPTLLKWVLGAIICELLLVEIPAEVLYTWTMIPNSKSLHDKSKITTLVQGPFYYGLHLAITGIYVHHIYHSWKQEATAFPKAVKNMFMGFALMSCMEVLCLTLQEAHRLDMQACVSVRCVLSQMKS
jgi:hypothetical protein